ncbi:hypothetical protein [Nostoc sp. CHAB 5715]|nr:hypothetical protein [Nostoc sp. CHAB 5715]MCC5622948.1 hypothetical protein [Nostoc sp. CHAB 5715]
MDEVVPPVAWTKQGIAQTASFFPMPHTSAYLGFATSTSLGTSRGS